MGITLLQIDRYKIKRTWKSGKLFYDLYIDDIAVDSSTLLDVLFDKIHINFQISITILEKHGYLVQLEYDQTGRVHYDIYINEQKIEEYTTIDEALKEVQTRIACDIAQQHEDDPCNKGG